MSISGQKIVTDARIVLNDISGTRWVDSEMLSYINAGRRDMAAVRPELWANNSRRTFTLVAGCYQNLIGVTGFTDVFALRDVLNNVTASGAVSSAIQSITRAQLDSFKPGWQSDTGKVVQNWCKDDANSLGFWVYPAVAGGKVSVQVSAAPADLSSLTETAVPMDVMSSALLNYVLYRCYAKDAEIATNAQLSTSYLSLFSSALGAKE